MCNKQVRHLDQYLEYRDMQQTQIDGPPNPATDLGMGAQRGERSFLVTRRARFQQKAQKHTCTDLLVHTLLRRDG